MNSSFWKATFIRALRTICQTAIAAIGSAVMLSDVNWAMVVSASVLAGVLSVLTSVATGLPEVDYAEHIYMSVEEPADSEILEVEHEPDSDSDSDEEGGADDGEE